MKKYFLFLLLQTFVACLCAQTSRQLVAYLPAIEGWSISDKVEVFDSGNLYDRINGGADAFLICNFVEMTAVDYTKNNSEVYITLQMYRHASPADAFCAYSGERSPRSDFLHIGTEAYREPAMLYFLSGSVYVKMQTHDKSPETAAAMEQIARALADKIEANPAFPDLLKAFPEADKEARSEVYIVESFLGHRFLHSAYRAAYRTGGKEYFLFILDGKTKEGAEKMLRDYLTFTKQPIAPEEGRQITLKDRYNGDIIMRWSGAFLLGVINDEGAVVDAASVLQELETAILK